METSQDGLKQAISNVEQVNKEFRTMKWSSPSKL
jgi:hypothetical protein